MDDDELFDQEAFAKLLGRHIARVRKGKGYSQDRLSLEAGLVRGTLSKIEHGKVEVKASTLARIAKTLRVPAKRMLDF